MGFGRFLYQAPFFYEKYLIKTAFRDIVTKENKNVRRDWKEKWVYLTKYSKHTVKKK